MINLGEAKKVTFKTLLENNIKDYQFEGLSLLSKILELDTKTIITENNIEISLEQKYPIEKITKKRIEGMPLAYLTKEKLFFNETFYVDKNVLIPRHETEELIDCFFSLIEKENLEVLNPEHKTKPRVYYKNLYRYNKCFIGGSVALIKNKVEDCVSGAVVKLIQNKKIISDLKTDDFGDFKFDKLEPNSGKYEVNIEYNSKKKTIELDLEHSIYLGNIYL